MVRVRAAAVTVSDIMTRRGRPLLVRPFAGLLRPRRPIGGTEFYSSVEVFIDDGHLALSARIYPAADDDAVSLRATGAAATLDLKAWPMSAA